LDSDYVIQITYQSLPKSNCTFGTWTNHSEIACSGSFRDSLT